MRMWLWDLQPPACIQRLLAVSAGVMFSIYNVNMLYICVSIKFSIIVSDGLSARDVFWLPITVPCRYNQMITPKTDLHLTIILYENTRNTFLTTRLYIQITDNICINTLKHKFGSVCITYYIKVPKHNLQFLYIEFYAVLFDVYFMLAVQTCSTYVLIATTFYTR